MVTHFVIIFLADAAVVLFDDAFNEVPCGTTCAVTFPDVVPVSLVDALVNVL
jgi:hypothetical protein